MIIHLIGSWDPLSTLESLVQRSLSELGLADSIEIQSSDDPAYKMELGITENPALCIEESSIDFRDMIFQGEPLPEYEEIKSMFLSILGDEDDHGGCGNDSCGTGGCGSCGGWCH